MPRPATRCGEWTTDDIHLGSPGLTRQPADEVPGIDELNARKKMNKRPILAAVLVAIGLLSLLVLWRVLHPPDPCGEMMRRMDEMFVRSGGVRVPGGWNFTPPSNSVPSVDAALAAVLQPPHFAAPANTLIEKPCLVTETELVETEPDAQETERRRIESMTLVDDRKKEANEPNRVGGSD